MRFGLFGSLPFPTWDTPSGLRSSPVGFGRHACGEGIFAEAGRWVRASLVRQAGPVLGQTLRRGDESVDAEECVCRITSMDSAHVWAIVCSETDTRSKASRAIPSCHNCLCYGVVVADGARGVRWRLLQPTAAAKGDNLSGAQAYRPGVSVSVIAAFTSSLSVGRRVDQCRQSADVRSARQRC